MEVIFLIVIFVAGFFVGESVALYRMRQLIRKIAKTADIDIDREIELSKETTTDYKVVKLRKLETEIHGDMIYLFDNEKNDFICQAKTIEELAKLAKEHKNILGAIVKHGDQTLVFADGESQEINK